MSALPAVTVPAKKDHSATVVFLHGLGDTGNGWAPVFQDQLRFPYTKYICPHAPSRPVTINMGMTMPAWFDIFGLSEGVNEDVEGIHAAAKQIHAILDAEVASGIDSRRIVLGGFSMGGALALYSAFTYDRPLAGVVALSAYLLQKDAIPGNHTANKTVRIFQGHGEQDPLVQMRFATATNVAIKVFNPNIVFKTYSMGHSACEAELKDVEQFLQEVIPPKK